MRGSEGFGAKHGHRTDRLLTLSEDLPLVAVAVDTRPKIATALDAMRALPFRGLATLERARMVTGPLTALELPEVRHEATKLTVYVGRQERAAGRPAHEAVVELLHGAGVAGATVLLGVDGTAHGARRRAAFFARNAEVPLMIVSVGEGSRIAAALPGLGDLLERPLVTLERVPRLQARRRPAGDAGASPRDRPVRPRGLAEAHGVRRRAGAPRGPSAASAAGAGAARGGRRRRHEHPRHLGLPRRPRAARRQLLAAAPPRPRRDDRHRHARAHPRLVPDRRPAHGRDRARDERDGARLPRRRARPRARRHEPRGATRRRLTRRLSPARGRTGARSSCGTRPSGSAPTTTRCRCTRRRSARARRRSAPAAPSRAPAPCPS